MNIGSIRRFLPLSLLAVAACAAAPIDEEVQETNDELTHVTCDDVSGTLPERSLAITDKTILEKFTFAKTMSTIRASADTAAISNTALYQTWMKTFDKVANGGTCDSRLVDPNNYNTDADFCPRSQEVSSLATIDPFAAGARETFEPVALFNRFDLAPSNGKNCGEYRIIYALKGGPRAFIIFEAAMPNPHPEKGIEACLPVAQFWQGLSKITDPATRTTKLLQFYYQGTAVAGFEPVVKASHYGMATNTDPVGSGQIRTNTLVSKWLLREFKPHRECTDVADAKTCKLSMRHVTVKNNPADELFTGKHARSELFRTAFVNNIPRLSAATAATISMNINDGFNEFESVSQPDDGVGDVAYARLANADMKNAIQTKLTELKSTLTVNQILTRAETQTCAGCHRLSAGSQLGGGAGTWPQDGFFVQVNENGSLSPALTQSFLPRRKEVLEKFINDRCVPKGAAPAAQQVDPDLNIGGGAVDAPN